MTIRETQEAILKLKKERDTCILAHSYEAHEILEVADFTGDSYALSCRAAQVAQKTVLMCGVRFMAETVKLLSPDKTVLLSSPGAGCPMAEQFGREEVERYRAAHPGLTVVAYVNTTAELKRVCDICVTSSSAVRIVSQIPDDREILFIPDCNLGAYVASALPQKKLTLWHGGCPVHAAVTVSEVKDAKASHPGALLLVHPECTPGVVALSDFVGSTAAIMKYARESNAREFLIGTEISIAEHLGYELPDKRFYPLTKNLVCRNMRLTTLVDVLHAVEGDGGEEITLSPDTLAEARRCIDRMMELGG